MWVYRKESTGDTQIVALKSYLQRDQKVTYVEETNLEWHDISAAVLVSGTIEHGLSVKFYGSGFCMHLFKNIQQVDCVTTEPFVWLL